MKCTGIRGMIKKKLPPRIRNNYAKKFNTSIQFWHHTGGGLDEETIHELEKHGYKIKRNGVSNYTASKKSRVIFLEQIQFWHHTGGGLDEETIHELEKHGYKIKRNGVSNYTASKKSRVIFLEQVPDDTDDIKSSKDIPSWKRIPIIQMQ